MIDYEKQTFVDGQILTADCLNRMEKGIENACNAAPPECEVADCSMVLSHGANGCEWVPRIIPANEGGYYTPTINQVDENTLEFTFTPSKSGMAEVSKLTVTIPAGADGKDGRGIVSVKRTAGTGAAGTNDTYTITYSDKTTSTFTVHNGADGSGGSGGSGEQGATFYPSVDADGNLSWTNNKGLDNPETVNIRGPQGAAGASVTHEWDGTTLKVTSASGTSSADLVGPAGTDGVGIQEVKMVQTSTEDEGLNVVSMVKTDGTRFQFYVKNGSKGSKGDTPVAGTDYFTDADKEELAGKIQLQFHNIAVPVASWAADSTYAAYPYRASITLSGVTAAMIPEVIFGIADAASGNYAPGAATYGGGVYIYAVSQPEAGITIPTIVCWRGGASA